MWVHRRLVVCDAIWEAGDSARASAKVGAKCEAGSRKQPGQTKSRDGDCEGWILELRNGFHVYSDVHG